MTERNRGQVVPFALSPLKMRSGAAEHIKRGRPVEAVELLRRAAQEDDRPEGWLRLAQQLRGLHCPEQAAAVLRRAIARERLCAGMWYELALCQLALEENEGAVDCLYHALQEDPYDDEARELLCDTENASQVREAFRMPALIQRGLQAWDAGDRSHALRIFRRGIKIARRKAPVHLTLALMHISEGDRVSGIREAAKALRREPKNLQALLIIAAAAWENDKRRLAHGLLMRAMGLCDEPAQERLFLDMTEKIGAVEARRQYLHERLKRAPYRIALLRAMANECLTDGEYVRARQMLNTILRLDPSDLKARAQIEYTGEPSGGSYPRRAVHGWLTLLMERLPGKIAPEEIAAAATPLRDALDWCLAQPDGALQEAALTGICREDSPQLRAYLREKLVSRGLTENARNMVLVRLAALGDDTPKAVLVGQRMATAQATSAEKSTRQQGRFFLRTVLLDAGRSGHASQMVHFAAQLWRRMTAKQRAEAAGESGYVWVKAIEILYFRMNGLTEAEADLRRDMLISPRRVQRVVHLLALQADLMKGEEP